MTSRARQSRHGAPRGAPLGIHAKFASRPSRRGTDDRSTRLHRRYSLQAAARALLPRERVAICGRKLIPTGGSAVGLHVSTPAEGRSVASFSGLQVCGSSWLCPVCSAKISEKRRLELAQGMTRWLQADSHHRIVLVTFTLSHHAGESFATVLDGLRAARRRVVSGRWAADFRKRFGVVGMVRSLEVTHGANGWHPHLHVLYLLEAPVDEGEVQREMSAAWRAGLAARGRYATWASGVKVTSSDAALAEYVAKHGREPRDWGLSHEVAKGSQKRGRAGGRTPFELLDAWAHERDPEKRQRWARLWLTYASHIKGENAIRWSTGLRELLGLGDEQTEEEIASEVERGGFFLASIGLDSWRVILAHDARADVLLAAADGREKLAELLGVLGCPPDTWWIAPEGGR